MKKIKINKFFEKLMIKSYIFLRKSICMIAVLDAGIDNLIKKPYKDFPSLSVNMARQLLIILNEYDNIKYNIT